MCPSMLTHIHANRIMGDAGRLLNAWDGLAASPVLREFRWSPLVELAFDTNRETISPAQISAPYLTSLPADLGPRANPSATRYAPLPGLLAMHIRRGDFAGHCEHLGRWSSPWVGFNSFAALPDVLDTGRLPSDEAARIELYRTHCFPNIAEIVVRAEALRVAEAEGGRGELRDVYVMTNGPVEWVAELEAALKETGHWRHVASSRDLLVNQEQKYVKQAVDMLIGQRAQVFVGNGVSVVSCVLVTCTHRDWTDTVVELDGARQHAAHGKWDQPQADTDVVMLLVCSYLFQGDSWVTGVFYTMLLKNIVRTS